MQAKKSLKKTTMFAESLEHQLSQRQNRHMNSDENYALSQQFFDAIEKYPSKQFIINFIFYLLVIHIFLYAISDFKSSFAYTLMKAQIDCMKSGQCDFFDP